MRLLNRIGGALLALVIVILLVAGYRSATGRQILGPLGQSASRMVRWVRDNVPTVPGVAGNGPAAVLVGLALFSLAMIFIPGLRGGRGMVAAAVVATVIAFLVYQPSLLPS